MQQGSSDLQRQNLHPLRLSALGKMGDDPIAAWKDKIKWYSENNHVKDMYRIDGIRVENIPRIHDVGPLREDSKSNDRPTERT